MSDVDMKQALGIQPANGPQIPPHEMAYQVAHLACKYLLYERAEQTEVTAAFAMVVEERHKHFHTKHVYLTGEKKGQQVPWGECSNPVCEDARKIIARQQRMEIYIPPLSAQVVARYQFNFMPMPGNLRVWLSKREEQLPPTQQEQQQAQSGIILTDN